MMMSAPGPSKRQYGLSTDLFVSRKGSDQTIVLGGRGEQSGRWVHVLTAHAAHLLWYKLTLLLYPEKAGLVTGLAVTAPLRAATLAITTQVEVIRTPECQYTVVGWVERAPWMMQLSELEARNLWTALDQTLYPVGWEGRQSRPKPICN